ncbi:hypothetical protein [Clostridium perfringens]|uniref:hypothetical protein n=1 Tax=Clostridium perfringens TaxID=1502 RepID=UPI001FB11F90|nr:hypothetical protein [Clostridium perfringens]
MLGKAIDLLILLNAYDGVPQETSPTISIGMKFKLLIKSLRLLERKSSFSLVEKL